MPAFRDHSSPALKKCRVDFLRTRVLVTLLYLAASIGCVSVLEELVDNWHCELSVEACAAAARKGHLDALVWLHSRSCAWESDVCGIAALGGHLEVLRGGHLEVLRYAHEHGCQWDNFTSHHAPSGGHVEVLRYAHEHSCSWDSVTCEYAALEGHLEVLRYAHEHGCPWDSYTCQLAARTGHLELLRYAHEHGCPLNSENCRAVALALGHAEVVAQAAKAAEEARAQAVEAAMEAKEVKAQAAEAANEAKAKTQAKPATTPTSKPSSIPRSTPTHRPAPPAKLQHTDSRVEKETHAGPSTRRPDCASARLEARAELELPALLRALTVDLLHAIIKLVDDADLLCARLVCRAFRDHSRPALKKCHVDFLRTRVLAVFA
ncbi:hypothetical protein T492DRAFT_873782 [Pavlovales sp. CCMP2436]|nr:hypothetical protein T492DRAFT_873782 [Pavlovales sp. CCMP2436]